MHEPAGAAAHIGHRRWHLVGADMPSMHDTLDVTSICLLECSCLRELVVCLDLLMWCSRYQRCAAITRPGVLTGS